MIKTPKDNISTAYYRKEMQALLNVGKHQNMMQFMGMITDKAGVQCFVVEYCKYGSLDKLHKKINLTEPDKFWKIATGTLLGLSHMHQNNLIHRDIACRNLLVNSNWEVKIADFGLTVLCSSDSQYASNSTEKLPWAWMSPETLKTGIFSKKSDIWSAGVTFWEILTTGLVPYAGKDGKWREK